MLGMLINFYDMQTCVALVHFIFSFFLLMCLDYQENSSGMTKI